MINTIRISTALAGKHSVIANHLRLVVAMIAKTFPGAYRKYRSDHNDRKYRNDHNDRKYRSDHNDRKYRNDHNDRKYRSDHNDRKSSQRP